MLLPSANEAAYIVADYMGGGSIDNFVAMMNEEAQPASAAPALPLPTPAVWIPTTSPLPAMPT